MHAKGDADDSLEAAHVLRLRVSLAPSAGDVDLDRAVLEVGLGECRDERLVDVALVPDEWCELEGMAAAVFDPEDASVRERQLRRRIERDHRARAVSHLLIVQ